MTEKYKENLRVFALGGLNEVGKNCYILEKKNDIIIIDAGVKFLNNNYNLANASVPNFEYLKKYKEKIKGIFVTHGHEDHIGSIPHLLQEIPNIPVYGSEFSLTVLKQKFKNGGTLISSSINDESIITTPEFKISFFRVTHSIPGSFGVIIEIRENKSKVVMTGDFKFDWTAIGEKSDILKLAECGKNGVDLLLSDSTNAQVRGTTPSETKVIERLENIISNASGRVIITSFASNVYRLKKIIEIAKKHQKKIALLGSSLLRMMEAIKKVSLWKIDSSVFVEIEDIKKFSHEKLIIFCTGSQGEEKAVLSRLANENYQDLKISKGDSIILTSSPIMDNRFNLEQNNEKLNLLGAIINENSKNDLLHASGHASQEDLKLMLVLVNPKNFMPMHGDHRMLKAHASLAKEFGISKKNIFVCENGEVISQKKDNNGELFFCRENEKIITDPNYLFGQKQKIIPNKLWNEKIETRNKMYKGGVIIILIFISIDKDKNIKIERPHLYTYGFINIEKNKELIKKWKKEILTLVTKIISNKENINIEKKIEISVEKIFKRDWKEREPAILPIIINSKK